MSLLIFALNIAQVRPIPKKKMIMKFGSGKKHILRLRSFERCKN